MFDELAQQFANQYDNGNWQHAVIVSVLILAGSFVIHTLSFMMLKRFTKRSDKPTLRLIWQKSKNPSLGLVMTIALYLVFFAFAPANQLVDIFMHLLSLLIIFFITWLIIRVIKFGREIVLLRYDIEEKDNLKARRVYTQFKIMERILIFIVLLIAISIALMTFEQIRKVGVSLFASAGVAGIILGFAAQKLIGNVLAGFQIAIAQPIRLEDVVIVEKEWGWIEEINLTYVVVRIWDKRRLILPTTYFIEKPFQNWTRISADILGTVFIFTDYSVPIDKLRGELTRILQSDKNWDGKVNVLQVTDSTEKTMEIRALMSAADSPSAWDLRVHVREKLIDYLQRNYPESLPKSRIEMSERSASPTGTGAVGNEKSEKAPD
ncbi:MAG: mechanosensitive ion channel [Bacteroidales bacterium]|nr:mechanosensitive ion channel [Bacteroidales bacterium]